MIGRPLDLDTVEAFVKVAELGSFTLAAEVMQTSQAAVSLKLKRLEERLGCRLLERTPRSVELSARGAAFLSPARDLLEANRIALTAFVAARSRLRIGISDHVAGPELPALIAGMNERDAELLIDIRIASSGDLLQRYDRRELDAVLVRMHTDRQDGELVCQEPFGWFAGPSWRYRSDEPLPIVTLAEPCGVRALAAQSLDAAEIPWTEVFVGGGLSTVCAAVMAGIGVAAIAPRMMPLGAVDVAKRLGLPPLPHLPVVLHSRVTDERATVTLKALASAFKAAVKV